MGNTAWGRQHIESLVAYLTCNHVRLHRPGWGLPDRPTLRELQLADAQGIWLQAENLEALTWHPWALLQRRVAVAQRHVAADRLVRACRYPNRTAPGMRAFRTSMCTGATADIVHLSAALAGTAATLNLHASAHLRSVDGHADGVCRNPPGRTGNVFFAAGI